MVYVALLRGVNVGGQRRVDMKELKAAFEGAGMNSVRTYINSGNVVFSTSLRGRARLASLLEEVIKRRFGFAVEMQVRDLKTMRGVVGAMPAHWKNDQSTRCYVMFLWKDVDRPSIVERLSSKPEIDEVTYVRGSIIWRVDQANVTRSGMMNVARTPLYKQMTIRNCNTVRKLLELMEACQLARPLRA